MNFFIFILFSYHFEDYPNNLISILISLIFGLLIPVFTFIQFRRKGKIINDDATIKEERTVPYIYAIFFSITGLIISALFQMDVRILMLWLIYLISSILIININRFWKISAHALGVGMPLGGILFINDLKLSIIGICLMILVIFARMKLKVHTLSQVIAGAFLGVAISYILLIFFT
jgi:membrane-associated phospholipid phosphatase